MAAQNSINNRTTLLTIDPGASADSYVQYSVAGSAKFRMGDDQSASDAFKVSIGSALGTSDAFVMTAAGENTMPLQPAFSAYLSSTASDVTGDGTTYTLACNTEIFDQQSNYNNGTYTFTAPVSGRYVFSSTYYLGGITAIHFSGYANFITSNTTFRTNIVSYAAWRSVSNEVALNNAVFCDMDSADTIYAAITVQVGTKVVDVIGSAAPGTVFQGALIC
jgi:hypothetical protein